MAYGLVAARLVEGVVLGAPASAAAAVLPTALRAPGRASPQLDDRYVAFPPRDSDPSRNCSWGPKKNLLL